MASALQEAVAPLPHIELRASTDSPIAQVRLTPLARSVLTPAQQEAALRRAAAKLQAAASEVVKPKLLDSKALSSDGVAAEAATARTLDNVPVKGNVSVALESEVPNVTVPIVLLVNVFRQTVRRYIQRQMELHELALMPPLHKLRNAGLNSPLVRRLSQRAPSHVCHLLRRQHLHWQLAQELLCPCAAARSGGLGHCALHLRFRMAVDVPRQRRRPPFLCDALLVRRLRLGHPVLGAEPARHLRLLPARLPVGGRHRLCAPFLGRLLARRRPGRHARRRRPRARVASHLRLGQRLDRLAKLVPAWPATMGGPRRRRGPPPPRASLHRHRAALLVRL